MRALRLIVSGAAVAVTGVFLGWAAWAAIARGRYGLRRRSSARDDLLDRFLPQYEAGEAHDARVNAPAALAYAVATGTGLQASAVVRAVIRARERLLRAGGGAPWPPGGIVAQMRTWGWGVIAEAPERAIVLGTVTQPWHGDVRFLAVAPDAFEAFDRPGFVKIVVAISAVPTGPGASLVRVQTRVATTDASARARFRRYWAVFSPGILLIRWALLRRVKREAERRHLGARTPVAREALGLDRGGVGTPWLLAPSHGGSSAGPADGRPSTPHAPL